MSNSEDNKEIKRETQRAIAKAIAEADQAWATAGELVDVFILTRSKIANKIPLTDYDEQVIMSALNLIIGELLLKKAQNIQLGQL